MKEFKIGDEVYYYTFDSKKPKDAVVTNVEKFLDGSTGYIEIRTLEDGEMHGKCVETNLFKKGNLEDIKELVTILSCQQLSMYYDAVDLGMFTAKMKQDYGF